MMKGLLVICLVFVGALGYPQNDIKDVYRYKGEMNEQSNMIEDNVKPFNGYKNNYLNEDIPFKSLPMKVYEEVIHLKPSQLMSLSTVLKAILKPILTSTEFHIFTQFVDESLKSFSQDPTFKLMMKESVDYLQNIYKIADEKFIDQFATWMVAQYSDEKTARSFSTLLTDFRPTLDYWLISPVKSYYRNYVSPAVSKLSSGIGNVLGEDFSRMARESDKWSDVVDYALNYMSEMTTDARHTLETTARFLKEQQNHQF